MPSFRHTRPLLTFFGLAFAISWLGYLPFLLLRDPSRLWLLALVLPGTGPALAAGLTQPRHFWPRLKAAFMRPVRWPWYVVAALGPTVLLVLANRLDPAPRYPFRPTTFLLVLALDLAANPCEEIGWRGFALPRLQARYNPTLVTILLGLLWGLWHLPLFLWPATSHFPLSMSQVPVAPWFVAHMAGTFLYTSLYNTTGRSLFAMTLFHLSFNLSGQLLGMGSTNALAGVETAAAVLVLVLQGSDLGRKLPAKADAQKR